MSDKKMIFLVELEFILLSNGDIRKAKKNWNVLYI